MQSQLMISDGRGQHQRQLAALSGDYFQLQELRFEQLLAMATEYARLVHFYQLDMRVDGDWQSFFSADESILMASVLAIDVQKIAVLFEARLETGLSYREWFHDDLVRKLEGSYRDRLNSPVLLARMLDRCLLAFSALQTTHALGIRRLLQEIVRGLKWEVRSLCQSVPRALLPYARSLFSDAFCALCEWPNASEMAKQDGGHVALSVNEVRHNFYAFAQALRMLQKGLRDALPASMTSGEHDPAISLLIGFVHLLQSLQQRLNRFSDHHIDFYYHRVLGMQQQGQQIDSAYLLIKPSPTATQIKMDKGTQFVAGVDASQQEIVYRLDEDVMLSDARVAALHTLYFQRRRPLRHHAAPVQLATSAAFQTQLVLPGSDSNPEAFAKLPPLPLMGAPKPGEHVTGAQFARFGFAIASQTLLMQEGERHVRVVFHFNESHDERGALHLRQCLRDLVAHAHPSLSQQSELDQIDVFVKLVRSMFKIALSTQEGWYPVTEYKPTYQALDYDLPDHSLAISFVLPASAPAITVAHTELHGEGAQGTTPMIRFEMTQNEYAYPYAMLTQWMIAEVEIEVDVKACRQLVLHNQIGQLSALAPFLPFGPLPDLSSYLIVACEEVLEKTLTEASLEVEWAGLPQNLGGFASYYRAYQTPLKADAVSMKLAVLVDGKWQRSMASVPVFELEQHEDGSPSNQVRHESRWNLKPVLSSYKPAKATTSASGFNFTPATMNGMFKLSLDSPDGALGHQEYPQLLTRILTKNAQTKKVGLMQALPNLPYTPQISRIVFNYKAHSRLNFHHSVNEVDLAVSAKAGKIEQGSKAAYLYHDQFMHLHPFGCERILGNESRSISLIPTYPHAGNLLIGLEASQLSGPLHLYFYLREDSLPMTGIKQTGLSWWYLVGNRWKKLQQAHILDDSTHGFMTSGIVQLQVPDEINRSHSVMPDGLFWIGVSCERGIDRFCSVYSVFAQAIKVSWAPEFGKKEQAVLPAWSISKSRSLIAGVDSIAQVRASFDGKAQETRLQFRTRASERLRHKNRAVNAADYEALILEKFPQVAKVKCFSHLCSERSKHRRVRPGHILIIPLPHLTPGGHANQKPNLSGHLINEIQHYIEQFASADVRVSVENPVYEEIQVRCTVTLKAQYNHHRFRGRYIEQINQAICEYLSPWNPRGQHQHFGWRIQQHNIVSFLHELDYVEDVTGVSLLQISPHGIIEDVRFDLKDNAKLADADKDLVPCFPWSIAVPLNEHWIVVTDHVKQKMPKAIGINELKVGSTFIIPMKS